MLLHKLVFIMYDPNFKQKSLVYLLAAIPLKLSTFTETTDSSYIFLFKLILFRLEISLIFDTVQLLIGIVTSTSLIRSHLCSLINPGTLALKYRKLRHNIFTTWRAKAACVHFRSSVKSEDAWRSRSFYTACVARANAPMCAWRLPVSAEIPRNVHACRSCELLAIDKSSMCAWGISPQVDSGSFTASV